MRFSIKQARVGLNEIRFSVLEGIFVFRDSELNTPLNAFVENTRTVQATAD